MDDPASKPDLPIKPILGPDWEMEIVIETEEETQIVRDILNTENDKTWR
jgi:hypothetical protein